MVSKIGKGKLKTVKNVSSKNIKPQKTSRSPTQKTEIQKSGIQKMAEETVKFSAPFEQAPQVLTPILDKALEQINKSKNGALIYLRQEGRGIGLFEKIKRE